MQSRALADCVLASEPCKCQTWVCAPSLPCRVLCADISGTIPALGYDYTYSRGFELLFSSLKLWSLLALLDQRPLLERPHCPSLKCSLAFVRLHQSDPSIANIATRWSCDVPSKTKDGNATSSTTIHLFDHSADAAVEVDVVGCRRKCMHVRYRPHGSSTAKAFLVWERTTLSCAKV